MRILHSYAKKPNRPKPLRSLGCRTSNRLLTIVKRIRIRKPKGEKHGNYEKPDGGDSARNHLSIGRTGL
jgi:hypothetical protein